MSSDQPSQDQNQMVKWSCQIDESTIPPPQVESPSGQIVSGLTVGHPFILSCQGETGTLRQETLRFKFEKKDDMRVVLLDVRRMAEFESEFLVTSYVAGGHQLKDLVVTDGLISYQIPELRFQVQSVIDPTKPPEAPYGPMGPISMSLPLSFYLVTGAIFLAFAALCGAWFYRRHQRRRLIERLKQQNTALGAFHQLQKDLRVIQRELGFTRERSGAVLKEYVERLQEAFQMYLVRELLIPANEWSRRLVLKELKKRHPKIHKSSGKKLSDLLIELEKTIQSEATQKDFEQLVLGARAVADEIHKKVAS